LYIHVDLCLSRWTALLTPSTVPAGAVGVTCATVELNLEWGGWGDSGRPIENVSELLSLIEEPAMGNRWA